VIRNFLRNFMIGRYGPDQLGMAAIVVSLIVSLLSGITGLAVLRYVSYALLVIALWRMLSKNTHRRRSENDRFIRVWWPLRTKIKRFFTGLKDRKSHSFFKCPGCKNVLRVPKGKGKLQITCPKCGERFVKKT
jgi:ribosomal protein S27E